jgi:hypothetical protein
MPVRQQVLVVQAHDLRLALQEPVADRVVVEGLRREPRQGLVDQSIERIVGVAGWLGVGSFLHENQKNSPSPVGGVAS